MRALVVLVLSAAIIGLAVGVGVLYATYWRRVIGPRAWARFLTRTGYRRQQDPSAPLDVQARLILDEILPRDGRVRRGPWVRDYHGLPITFTGEMSSEVTDGTQVMTFSESWSAPLPQPSPVGIQVVDRRLVRPGMTAAILDRAQGRSREFVQRFPHPTTSGDPAFDARFLVFADDPPRAAGLLADAALRQGLSALPEVSLEVAGSGVRFDDPDGATRKAVLGRLVASPTTMLEREPQVHDRVAEPLRRVAFLLTGA